MDEGGPSVIDPQISEFRAFDARFGRATHGKNGTKMGRKPGKTSQNGKLNVVNWGNSGVKHVNMPV